MSLSHHSYSSTWILTSTILVSMRIFYGQNRSHKHHFGVYENDFQLIEFSQTPF